MAKIKVYGKYPKTRIYTRSRQNVSGTRYVRSLQYECKLIDKIDHIQNIQDKLIPIEINSIGRVWRF